MGNILKIFLSFYVPLTSSAVITPLITYHNDRIYRFLALSVVIALCITYLEYRKKNVRNRESSNS